MGRVFIDTLKDIRNGGAVNELDDELRTLVQKVRETGRKGELKLTIAIRPASKGNVDVLMIDDKIEAKAPKPEKGASIVYANADGTLSRKDPRQPELTGLREVPTIRPATEAREVLPPPPAQEASNS